MKRMMLAAGLFGLAAAGPLSAIEAVRVGTGFSNPLFVTAPAGDAGRLFVAEKGGDVRVLDLATGNIAVTPFLDLAVDTNGERGLLGMAFHPDYTTNGKVYVNLINNTTFDTEVREYTVSAENPNVADTSSGRLIMTITQPAGRDNHKGGWIGFSPTDGLLYVASGDGGSGNDPDNYGQRLDTTLGKMLRIDINSDGFPADPNRNYAIPANNPFVATAGAQPEIFAYGLRNPYRSSFDRETGDLYIGDVGQSAREEIDFIANGSPGGQNFGWRLREGTIATPDVGGALPGATDPIYDYTHGNGTFQGRSVTGGYVYRGSLLPELDGTYFFGDFIRGKVWSFDYDGSALTGLTDWTETLRPDVGNFGSFSSFGEGGTGELFIVNYGGDIFQVVPEPGVSALLIATVVIAMALAKRRRQQTRR